MRKYTRNPAPKHHIRWKSCSCVLFFLSLSSLRPLKLITFYGHFQLRFVQSTKDLVGLNSEFVSWNSFRFVRQEKNNKKEKRNEKDREKKVKKISHFPTVIHEWTCCWSPNGNQISKLDAAIVYMSTFSTIHLIFAIIGDDMV